MQSGRCMRYSIRSLAVAVALAGINLAGMLTTAKFFPREFPPLGMGWGKGWGACYTNEQGETFLSRRGPLQGRGEPPVVDAAKQVEASLRRQADPDDGLRLVLVEIRPLPPGLVAIWAPVIASVSITLLVLFVPWGRPSGERGPSPPATQASRSPAKVSVARWIVIVVALVGLNLAGAVYRPPPHRTESWRRGDPLYPYSPRWTTLVYYLDGRVIGYEGEPGATVPAPRLIRGRAAVRDVSRPKGVATHSAPRLVGRTRSYLEIWFLTFASAAITAAVLAALARCYWRTDRAGGSASGGREGHEGRDREMGAVNVEPMLIGDAKLD